MSARFVGEMNETAPSLPKVYLDDGAVWIELDPNEINELQNLKTQVAMMRRSGCYALDEIEQAATEFKEAFERVAKQIERPPKPKEEK